MSAGCDPHEYRLSQLTYRTGKHRTPDAIILIRKDFSAAKPIRLVVYNHGLALNVTETNRIWRLRDHLTSADPNTILVLPEWSENPDSYNSSAATFSQPGFFRKMLKEIFSKTPELKRLDIDDLDAISIVSFSGGFRAASSEIYNNDLQDKIDSVTLLDSLYVPETLDRWLQQNIHSLADGTKQFQNFYFDTGQDSINQLARVRKMLKDSGITHPQLIQDTARPAKVLDATIIAKNGIIFKSCSLGTGRFTPHMNVANVYLPQLLLALKIRSRMRAQ
jgi:hypothetical protein